MSTTMKSRLLTKDVHINDRIGTFKIKAMTNAQWEDYRARSRGKVSKKGMDFDSAKFNSLIMAAHVVEPNFANAEMLTKANCATASEFISKKILPGEISEIVEQITKLSGFDSDINEEIAEAQD